jgi:hypothetical protein
MARKPRPVIDAVVNRIRAKRPVVAAVIDGMRNAAADPGTSIQPTQVEARSAEHIAEAVAPLIVNANNDEPKNASRVISGSTVAAVSGFMVAIGPAIEAGLQALNRPEWLAAYYFLFGGTAAGGGLFSLFGRLRKGLPPMTFKPWNPFTWFAPRPAA